MKKRSSSNIDGFVVRRRDNQNPRGHDIDNFQVPERFLDKPKEKQPKDDQNDLPDAPELTDEVRLEDTQIDSQPEETGKKRGFFRRIFGRKKNDDKKTKRFGRGSKKRTWIKRILLALAALIVVVGAVLGIKAFLASQSVFDGNLFGLFSEKRLKTDQYGRTNVLVFGTSEDSPAHQATGEGPDLTDSMMILSVDQDKKDAYMLSIPRDLWVSYDRACISGYEGKINVAYQCAKDEDGERAGAEFLEGIVERDFGIAVQYFVHVNYTVLKESVDAVNGITVEIDSDDPRGILDRNFDWQCNYNCYYVNWPNGPAKLDGEHALALARARNAAGGYGLSGGNFDREQYQQKIIVALKEKAVSAGTLANPVKVTKLIDSLGKNVRTNFETGEIRTVVKLAGEISNENIKSLTLVDQDEPLVTTGQYAGQSIVQPVVGVYDFSEIKSYLKKNLSGDEALQEGASIDVLNASGVAGAASRKSDQITNAGLTVGVVGNAPAGTCSYVCIHDLSGGEKPATLAKLEQMFGTTASQKQLPAGVASTADFVILIGTDGAD